MEMRKKAHPQEYLLYKKQQTYDRCLPSEYGGVRHSGKHDHNILTEYLHGSEAQDQRTSACTPCKLNPI